MKSLLTTILSILFSATLMADDIMLTRCNGTDNHPGFGSSYGTTIQAAEQFSVEDMKPFVGGKMNRMRACFYIWPEGQLDHNGNPNHTQVTELEMWVKRDMNDEERLRSFKMSQPEGSGTVWVEVEFDEPLEILPDMPIALGYTYVQDNTDPPAYFIVLGHDDAYVWLDSGDGTGFRERDLWSLSIEANITKDLDYSAEITDVSLPSLFYSPGKQEKATVEWVNRGLDFSKITLALTCGDKTTEKTVRGNTTFGEKKSVPMTFRWPEDSTDDIKLSVAITAIDDIPYNDPAPYELIVSSDANKYTRNVLIEEGTGTWCGWCVRGYVAMEYMREKYPDTFIGIAVHSSDPMAISGYTGALGIGSFPGCTVDRVSDMKGISVSTDDFERYYTTEITRGTYADFTLSAYLDDNRVEAVTSAEFSFNNASVDLRMIYVLLEDGVTGYSQNNSYSGGAYGKMGGFENMPQVVTNLEFNDVARAVYPSFLGESGSFATSIVKGQTYSDKLSEELPSSIKNVDRLTLVAMLVDGATGEVVQAHKTPLRDLNAIYSPNASDSRSLYDLQGRRLDTVPAHGMYIEGGKVRVIRE